METHRALTAATKTQMGPIVEWHRADRKQRMTHIWVTGFFLLFAGGCMVGFSFFSKDPGWIGMLSTPAAVLGLALTVAGPIYCLGGFYLLLAQESWVAIHTLGLRVSHDKEGELFIPWAIFKEVIVDGENLHLVCQEQQISLTDKFLDVSLTELASRIQTQHHKAQQAAG